MYRQAIIKKYLKVLSLFSFIMLFVKGYFLHNVYNGGEVMKSVQNISQPFTESVSGLTRGHQQSQAVVHYVIVACKASNGTTKLSLQSREKWAYQMRHISVLLKSAAFLTSTTLNFTIITSTQESYDEITNLTQNWPSEYQKRLAFNRREVYYPPELQHIQKMFCLCSTERLFLPSILPEVDSVIFIDTDTLFMQPPEDLWEHFSYFDDHQMVGVTPCLYMYNEPHFKGTPSFGFSGLNAGVLLFNVTRVNQYPKGWNKEIKTTVDKYKSIIQYGDQGILNIIFSGRNGDRFAYEVGCEWNYRFKVCALGRNRCSSAASKGVGILHGLDNSFHKEDLPKFKAVFEAWETFDLRYPKAKLLNILEENLRNASQHRKGCATLSNIDDILLKGLRNHLEILEKKSNETIVLKNLV